MIYKSRMPACTANFLAAGYPLAHAHSMHTQILELLLKIFTSVPLPFSGKTLLEDMHRTLDMLQVSCAGAESAPSAHATAAESVP